jgi:hypothetical protein
VTIQNDSFLEDLDSTNGVTVNGMATKKHFLQNNDVVEIGKYKLKYLNDQPTQTTAADFERTMVLRAPPKQAAPAKADTGVLTNTQVGIHTTAAKAVQAENTGKFETTAGSVGAADKAGAQAAVVQILNGPNSGKELELVKNLTTLGKPGVQVAVLARRPHGYFITHVEGTSYPVVNGESLGEHPRQLNDHDIIELAGVKMEFYFKS